MIQIKKFIPQDFCLGCDICCRFSVIDSLWAPVFSKEEAESIIKDISREDIDRVIEILFDAWKSGKKVFIIGNGGSASTAVHFASDLNKCTISPGKKRMKAFSDSSTR